MRDYRVRKGVFLLLSACAFIGATLFNSPHAVAGYTWYGGSSFNVNTAKYIFYYTNQIRAKYGRSPLAASTTWNYISYVHSTNMYRTHTFAHNSSRFPYGWRTTGQRFSLGKPASNTYTYGENIAWVSNPGSYSYRTLAYQYVYGMWMKSSGHRANILNARFKYMGVGYYGGYATQFFSSVRGTLKGN